MQDDLEDAVRVIDKVKFSGVRSSVETPLRLSEVPSEILSLYQDINAYLMRAKISCRYQNSYTPKQWPRVWSKKVKIHMSQDLTCNKSPTLSDHNRAPKKWLEHKRRLKIAVPTQNSRAVRSRAWKIVKEVVNDRYGCTKTVGLRVDSVKGEVFLPLWSCGFVAIPGDRFGDREIKWVACESSIPSRSTYELQEILFMHTLIEAGWWLPEEHARLNPDDGERLISMTVTDSLALWPIETLEILDKMTFFQQHYQSKERHHVCVECPCTKVRDWTTSLLMQKVSKLRDFLIYERDGSGRTLKHLAMIQSGPSVTLKRTLSTVARRAISDLAADPAGESPPNAAIRH